MTRLPVLGAALALSLGLAVSRAEAALLAPSAVVVAATESSATVTQGNLALATDGDAATGFVVTTVSPLVTSGVQAAFSFDISGFSAVTGFVLTLDLVIDFGQALGLEAGRLGWTTGLFSGFIGFPAPSGTLVSVSLAATQGGANVNDLARYINGTTLTVKFTTELAAGFVPGTLSVDFREIAMDVRGTLNPTVVPVPGALPLFATMLGLGLLVRRGRSLPG
ncbi:hypothetical protein [Paracraurococcus ruber]|nr:hypothetical protein [Paracraurococcus ruber]